MSSDILFYYASILGEYSLMGGYLKFISWTIYLPSLLIYHASFILIGSKNQKSWQKLSLYLGYLSVILTVFLESATNLTRNYNFINSPQFNGDLVTATNDLFWVVIPFQTFLVIVSAINFKLLKDKEIKKSYNWYKYFWPLLGLTISACTSPLIVLSYYRIIPLYSTLAAILPTISFSIVAISLIYSITRYGLLIEDAKIIFNKKFIYSTLTMLSVVLIYVLLIFFTGQKFKSPQDIIKPYIFLYLIIASHPVYGWLESWMQDLFFGHLNGFTIVSDKEVAEALRNYHNPERLASSTLLRLNLTSRILYNGEASDPIEALQNILRQVIDNLEPHTDKNRRIKQNLKYQILKMIAFDQAEEGQILWELGFDEYPLKILSQENSTRPPKFKVEAPSDYSYKSRNAYINLKQEAIHDVAWRISYLEKRAIKGKI